VSDSSPDFECFLDSVRDGLTEQDYRSQVPAGLTERIITSHSSKREPASCPIPEEILPKNYGPYLLKSILGTGAGGTVYQGYDPNLDRDIAVKILSPSLADDQSAHERFLHEARSVAALHHDNLMPVLAVHQETLLPAFTMPLLKGETLQAKLDRDGPLSSDEVITLARQLGEGLRAAHHHDVLHRDIKPSNIFLEAPSGRARLMDFGLARALAAPSARTEIGSLLGTPEFLAPEQLDDSPILSPATDLYGLGATLHTASTGSPPFFGSSLVSLFKQIATVEPPKLLDFSEQESLLFHSLLAKDPTQRPQDADTFLHHLSEKTSPQKEKKLPKRWLFAFSSIAALIFLAVFLTNMQPESTSPPADGYDPVAMIQQGGDVFLPAGHYHFSSQLCPSRELHLRGEKGTVLQFTSDATLSTALQTDHFIHLENLKIRLDQKGGKGPVTLVSTTADAIEISNCRIEQDSGDVHTGNYISLQDSLKASLLLTKEKCSISITDSILLCRLSPLVNAKDILSFTAENSVLSAKNIYRSTRNFATSMDLTYCTILSGNFFFQQNRPQKTVIEANYCYFETTQNLLCSRTRPGATVFDSFQWSGDHNLFSVEDDFFSTKFYLQRESRGRLKDIMTFSAWQKHWKSDANSEVSSPILVNRMDVSPRDFSCEKQDRAFFTINTKIGCQPEKLPFFE